MFKSWKEGVDKNKAFGALITDLSKAFDCLSHNLSIAKLQAWGIDLSSLKLLQDYLLNRWQRTKEDHLWSSTGLYFGSRFVQLLYMWYVSVFTWSPIYWLCRWQHPFCGQRQYTRCDLSFRRNRWENFNLVLNQMKLNIDKCHLLLNTQNQNFLKIGNFNIKNFISEKLLGITFDCKLQI